MKKLIGIFSVVALSLTVWAFNTGDSKDIAIGSEAPMTDAEFADVMSGKSLSLNSAKGENGLIVIFSCNTCPFVLGWEDRYNDVKAAADKMGYGMLVVNSNEAKRTGADSPEAMVEHAKEESYKFPYVVDKNSELAKAFGATVTPQAYLFNGDLKLVYKGLIDDDMKNRDEAKPHLMDAMKALDAGKSIDPQETRARGCSIKKV